ncbi:MAG: cytochrome o ubiquinol oxidase subunit III [Pseudomonas sp.]|uniref:cytochrome c oxidase subunit 3 n=1 Tax=Pseudomonas sp. TaxID=306 RepID=UPI0012256255|nr:cytochrome c oxidase subunit 3 [Pseudomonas sp.]RZI76848.1 MAG: cytochrome o ubiquinol oxidase subunit III [Pseudomonas sp.]
MTGPSLRHAGVNLGATDPRAHAQAEHPVFGFWLFLMSDALIFALLLAVYGTMVSATMGGPGPASEFDLGAILIETVVLLTSSLTFGMAVLAMKYDGGARGRMFAWLAATLALGLLFLGLELRDFATMFSHEAYPTRSGFLSAFFALVPLHGLHVAAGCVWLLAVVGQVLVHGLDARTKINLLRLSLFWHFLDIVWIAIFSVVYLQGLIA